MSELREAPEITLEQIKAWQDSLDFRRTLEKGAPVEDGNETDLMCQEIMSILRDPNFFKYLRADRDSNRDPNKESEISDLLKKDKFYTELVANYGINVIWAAIAFVEENF